MMIAASNLIDQKFGADLVIQNKEEKKLYYIHIAADSHMSRDLIRNKGLSEPYQIKDGLKVYWKRRWNLKHQGHQMLFYDLRDSDIVELVNGNYFFREDYLEEYFDNLFNGDKYDVVGESEFEVFFEWMQRYKIENK